jgi:SAM-dependent methyltransferase
VYLEERGWEVWGCDPAEDAARSCTAVLGERFVHGGLVEAELPPQHFDLVLLNFCLEHMARPREAIGKALELLRPGGVVAIRVPNVDPALEGSAGAVFQLQLPVHCSFFAPESLRGLLERVGLGEVAMSTPLSLLEGVSAACRWVPGLDPERWIHRPLAPSSLVRGASLAALATLCLPGAWRRCRRGKGAVLYAAARRPSSS